LELLRPLFANVTGETRTAEMRFNNGLAELYSKAWSAEFLRKLLAQQNAPWLCTENEVGVGVKTIDEAFAVINAIRKRGHHKIVVKESLGLAGSNAMRLFEPEVLPGHQRWMEKALANGRQLVVEPWLERVVDFSIQLEMSANGLKLCGYTGLLNDAKGQFQGNFAESHHHKRIPSKVIESFGQSADISTQMLDFYGMVFRRLEEELRRVEFAGPAGIDAFLYHDATGVTRLKPVVEINPRYTMGRVMVELMKQTRQGSCGSFRLVNQAQLRTEGFAKFSDYAASLRENFPLQFEGEQVQKIRSGAVCLNDPAKAQVCLGVFRVGRTLADVLNVEQS
jgi:hypothetical protein